MIARWVGFGMAVAAWAVGAASSQSIAIGADPGPGAGGVDVEGVVTYTGPLLEPVPISEAGTVRHPIVRDPGTKGLLEAVVWLEGAPPAPAGEDLAASEAAVMDQVNYEFLPHVLAVRAGRRVRFLNSDGANHGVTAASLEPRNRFNVVTPPGGRHEHAFVASRHPVAIGCPIHAAMAGWVYVFDHPYFAVTDERGNFRLRGVPPGDYTLHVRHPDGGMIHEERISVRRGHASRVGVEFDEADLKVRRPSSGR